MKEVKHIPAHYQLSCGCWYLDKLYGRIANTAHCGRHMYRAFIIVVKWEHTEDQRTERIRNAAR